MPRGRPKQFTAEEQGAKAKARAATASRNAANAVRDIGEMPPVQNIERKQACREDFRLFCETYYPDTFALGWSKDHLEAIELIEGAVINGGLFALAMPRGNGKSTLCETAAQWAVLYGHRKFVVIIGAEAGLASDMLDSIKVEIETNERLAADFPEVCFPVEKLDGISQRANGQLYQGERTHIGWKGDKVTLPTISGSAASGNVMLSRGITGSIRGMKHKRLDGTSARPDLVIIDDPQTDASARSPSQSAEREAILAGAVLGLAGPGKKIAGLMPCTVIREGDMADKILDRERHPEWQGKRTMMLPSLPTDEKLWEEYGRLRVMSLREHGDIRDATKFYKKHRKKMDEGAVASWPDRHHEDELSAIQHAMNLKLTDQVAFWAEYQNKPLTKDDQVKRLTVGEICNRVNNYRQGCCPSWTTNVTAFVDVQGEALFWVVMAWGDGMTGAIVDYGTYPDQKASRFQLSSIKHTLSKATGVSSLDGRIYAGLEALTQDLMGGLWPVDGDEESLPIDMMLIDANWGQSTKAVYQFCRQSGFSGRLRPSHGRGITASGKPMSDYKRKPGDRVGHYWRITRSENRGRGSRHVLYDTNYWKSFVHQSLSTPYGEPGAMTLFGKNPRRHDLIAEHITAESPVRTQGRGREVDEWKTRPDAPDNHWLDGVVGCSVAASMCGVKAGAWTDRDDQVTSKAKPERKDKPKKRPAERRAQSSTNTVDLSGGDWMAGF